MAAFPILSSPHSDSTTKDEANPHHPAAVAVKEKKGNSVKYLPLCHVYSVSSSRVSAGGSSNVMSNKVKARKLPLVVEDEDGSDQSSDSKLSSANVPVRPKPPIVQHYSLTGKCNRARVNCSDNLSVYDALALKLNNVPQSPPSRVVETENLDDEEGGRDNDLGVLTKKRKKRSKTWCTELIDLGADSSDLVNLDGPRLQENGTKIRNSSNKDRGRPRKKRGKLDANRNVTPNKNVNSTSSSSIKRWVRLSFDGVDPKKFIGLECKVYWPLDADWYSGRIVGYELKSDRHQVEYEDGEEENVILSKERIKFYITTEEMKRLRLSINPHCSDTDDHDVDVHDMVVLAACLGDSHEIESGDIIWAKLTGHAVWPAIVLDESLVIDRKGLNKFSGEKSVVIQFFGTHDFARVRTKQVISFLKGLLSSYCSKCKKPNFIRSLEEAKMYLTEQKLPKRMLRLQKSVKADCESTNEDEGHVHSGDECSGDESIQEKLNGPNSCPFEIGDLQVQSLGEIVKDSKRLKDKRYIWPIGYKAVRKFLSITDSSQCTPYTMEVLNDADSKNQPLFRVTSEDGEQFDGSTPSSCWNKIYKRIRNLPFGRSDGLKTEGVPRKGFESGSSMFGLSHPDVLKLLQETSNLKFPSKLSTLKSGRHEDLPVGYRPVHIQWKDLDRCNVCHMDEEYENNLFLQCDKCRMMVHARCYGELEPVDGVLWLCNLCRPGALDVSPPCCICPVIGGVMKPTTDGRWAHLACAMWIPETCLSDIKKMEPIDGLSRINKDRWKLLCSICGVPYGACIQCSNNNCYVAYHPLCARAAGFCAELANEIRLHMIPAEEDEDNQSIHLVSFCKKHSTNPSNERSIADERIQRAQYEYSDFTTPVNPSGCARCEPYSYLGRRGRKEPEALAAASLKRLFVENRPYLIGGYCQHDPLSSSSIVSSKLVGLENLKYSQLDASRNVFSMAEKYIFMRKTFRKRLAFGKSGIHGFGIFTKQPHRAGDMVIEYTGELVRPPIADRREHLIYNSLVGAGTYMFRIDDKRVIDATRAGSIAHLINHSCEPNCYSRVISVNGDDHIIIFAKRDIKQWEELTYDYRFFSIDEQLACCCGFSRCRGVVNDAEAEEQVAKVYAPRSELIDWRED